VETKSKNLLFSLIFKPVFIVVVLLMLCFVIKAQDAKFKNQKHLPVIQLNACDIEDRVVSINLKINGFKEHNINPTINLIEFGLYIKKNGVENSLRFANNKALIVNNQFEELPEAKFKVNILKSELPDPGRLDYKYDIDSKDLKDGIYQVSILELFKKLFTGTTLANGDNTVYLAVYPNRTKTKDPLELVITASKDVLNTNGIVSELIPSGKKIPVSNYFLYIDIDNCTDHNLLISAIKDSLEAVLKVNGQYYLYLSNPSSEAYTAVSSEKIDEVEPYESILNEIRRIEPGRAQIDKDINNLNEVISNIIKEAKNKKIKPEELRFVFLLPANSFEHKTKWLNKMSDVAKEKGFKVTPYFYDCSMTSLN